MLLLATQDEIYSIELVSNEEQTFGWVKWREKRPENIWITNCNIFPILLLFWNSAWNPVFKKLIEAGS
jgi:hypothetical protein